MTERRDKFKIMSQKKNSVRWGLPSMEFSPNELAREKVQATNLKEHVSLTIPYGYHSQVRKIAQMYRMDQLFRRMIERIVEFVCTGGEWELASNESEKDGKPTAKYKKLLKQKQFWDYFSSRINDGMSNVIPGKDTIDEWIVRRLLLDGMAVTDWEWGKISVNGVTYEVPTKFVLHDPLSVVISRPQDRFGEETTWLYLGPKSQRSEEIKENENYTTPEFDKNHKNDWVELAPLGSNKDTGAFAIKYQWTTADNTATITKGSSVVGKGVYPVPPYIGLLSSTIQRQALTAADISILDSIIGTILVWSIGDATKTKQANNEETLPNQPYPEEKNADGTVKNKAATEEFFDIIREQLSGDDGGNGAEGKMVAVPYYINGKYLEAPAINALLSSEKYVQPFIEILNAFGIIITPITGTPPKLEDLNRANLEQIILSIQRYVKRFWETLCREIIKRNKSLIEEPNLVWNPINTMTDNYREQLAGLAKRGRLSPQSDMRLHGRDPGVEIGLMKQNLANGTKKMLDDSTPVTFVQQTVTGDETKEVGNTQSPKTGRPKKVEGE